MPHIPVPAHVRPAHAKAIEETLGTLHAELGGSLRGVLLAGSVSSGAATSASDVDLFAVTGAPWWQRRRFTVAGIDVDLFVDPVPRIEHELAFGRSAVPISAFATGVVLFDDDRDTMTRLQAQARLVFAGAPRAVSSGELFAVRLRARDLLRLIENSEGSTQRYVAALFVSHAVECHYLVQRRWTVPIKRTLDDLAAWAPGVRALVERSLLVQGDELASVAVALCEAVFGSDAEAGAPATAGDRIPYRLG